MVAGRRVPHRLRGNLKTELPQRMLFLDTETYQVPSGKDPNVLEHVFRLAVACYHPLTPKAGREEWLVTEDLGELWDFILSHVRAKQKLWLFAHNWNFDFFIIQAPRFLKENGFYVDHIVADSSRFIVRARDGSRTLIFVDTFNFVPRSLAEIGKSIGLPKMDVDPLKAGREELVAYCRRDVEIIRKFVLDLVAFVRHHDLGNFKPTIASLAFSAYRHRFMPVPIYIHGNPVALELEKASYRGGRNECFFIGRAPEDTYYKLDVNSMYPFVMLSFPYPTALVRVEEDATVDGLLRALRKYLVIADVLLEVAEPAIGVRKKKLVFPVGRFRVTLTTPELEYVLKHGRLLRVYSYALYKGDYVFRDYVTYFYELRRKYKAEGNPVFDFLAKLFLNSLYGKFGERPRRWEPAGECPWSREGIEDSYSAETGEWETLMCLSGKLFRLTPEEWGFNSFPAIASHVTAYARMYLWELIKRAGRGNVFYCDTDSLIVNERGYRNLEPYINDRELGKLKLEGVSNDLVIKGCKQYRFGSEVKIKGVRGEEKDIERTEYLQERFRKARGLLRMGIVDRVIVELFTKRLRSTYDKGVVKKDGWVEPLELWEDG